MIKSSTIPCPFPMWGWDGTPRSSMAVRIWWLPIPFPPRFLSRPDRRGSLDRGGGGKAEDPPGNDVFIGNRSGAENPTAPETRIESGSGREELLAGTGREGYIVELWRLALDRTGQVIRREFINRSSYQPVARLLKTGIKHPGTGRTGGNWQ